MFWAHTTGTTDGAHPTPVASCCASARLRTASFLPVVTVENHEYWLAGTIDATASHLRTHLLEPDGGATWHAAGTYLVDCMKCSSEVLFEPVDPTQAEHVPACPSDESFLPSVVVYVQRT